MLTLEDAHLAAQALSHQSPDAVLINWTQSAPLTSLAFVERYSGLVAVVILSRHDVLIDVVESLRAGAADYMRQPCFFPEVLARVERARASSFTTRRLSVGKLSLNVAGSVAHIGDDVVRMTDREARILAALIRCPERAVSREGLMRASGIGTAKPTIIESYIKQLRKRHAVLRRCVQTKYGQGYAYCPE